MPLFETQQENPWANNQLFFIFIWQIWFFFWSFEAFGGFLFAEDSAKNSQYLF